ncbi:hypothetical protein EZS27_022741 [termite gut metagenome]|uniref:Uncharacterized protein n=1 Tax=termite gut metagenome TaxID=433724 RepID=A0A5J4R6T5_9ZZZZ
MDTTKIKNILIKNTKYGLILIAGLFLGWLIFGGSDNHDATPEGGHTHEEATEQLWRMPRWKQLRRRRSYRK